MQRLAVDVGDPEVGELIGDVIRSRADQHVRRLEIQMNDTSSVRMGEGIQDRKQDALQFGPIQGSGHRAQGSPGGELHGKVGAAQREAIARHLLGRQVDLTIVVYSDDVGMVQARNGPDLMTKRVAEVCTERMGGGHDLDRHGHLLSAVHTTPHLGHPALSKDLLKLECAERN